MKNYFRCGNSRIGILSENTFFLENYISYAIIKEIPRSEFRPRL